MFVADQLFEHGFDVLEAASGDEAIELLASGIAVDVVFSDVSMPGATDGLGLLEYTSRHYPGLPFVLCSGTLLSEEAIARGAAAFVSKPFVFETIEVALKVALGGDHV